MKKILIAAAAFSALASASFAADLPPARMPAKVEAPPPVMSWTGCYVGVGGGYGVTNNDHVTTSGGVGVSARTTSGGRGWFGTGQLGCDYQFDPNWVVGVFGDGNWGSIKGDYSEAGPAVPGTGLWGGQEKQKWSWAAGGRVGYLVYPTLMGFVSAGWSQAHYDQINLVDNTGAGFMYASNNYSGWFLGTGYEYKLTWLPGFTWRTEYRYTDYSSDDLTLLTAAGAPTAFGVNTHKGEQTIRSELVWRFNMW